MKKHLVIALSSLVLASTASFAAPSTPASASPASGTITGRASVMPGPTESAYPDDSITPIVSGNGRYIAFTSDARLVPEDHFSSVADVYVRDLLTDEVELISAKPDGTATP